MLVKGGREINDLCYKKPDYWLAGGLFLPCLGGCG